jgi:hypothetical protein
MKVPQKQKSKNRPSTMTQACNPSNSRGKDQENHGLKPAQGEQNVTITNLSQ